MRKGERENHSVKAMQFSWIETQIKGESQAHKQGKNTEGNGIAPRALRR